MKKLLLILMVTPMIGLSQNIIDEKVLNTVTIDSIKFDNVLFGYYDDEENNKKFFNCVIASVLKENYNSRTGYTTPNLSEVDLKYIVPLNFNDEDEIKRLKYRIREVKKNKEISFRETYFNDRGMTAITMTYNYDSDYTFYVGTSEESFTDTPIDYSSSIKYNMPMYGIHFFDDNILYFETDIKGMRRFVKFLENKKTF